MKAEIKNINIADMGIMIKETLKNMKSDLEDHFDFLSREDSVSFIQSLYGDVNDSEIYTLYDSVAESKELEVVLDDYNILYNGIQQGFGRIPARHLFTDRVTKSSFVIDMNTKCLAFLVSEKLNKLAESFK